MSEYCEVIVLRTNQIIYDAKSLTNNIALVGNLNTLNCKLDHTVLTLNGSTNTLLLEGTDCTVTVAGTNNKVEVLGDAAVVMVAGDNNVISISDDSRVVIAGNGSKVRIGNHSSFILIWADDDSVKHSTTVMADGITILANTWYHIFNNKVVEYDIDEHASAMMFVD